MGLGDSLKARALYREYLRKSLHQSPGEWGKGQLAATKRLTVTAAHMETKRSSSHVNSDHWSTSSSKCFCYMTNHNFCALSPQLAFLIMIALWFTWKLHFWRGRAIFSLLVLQNAYHTFGVWILWTDWNNKDITFSSSESAGKSLHSPCKQIPMGLQCWFHMSTNCRSSSSRCTLWMKDCTALLLWKQKAWPQGICPLNRACQSSHMLQSYLQHDLQINPLSQERNVYLKKQILTAQSLTIMEEWYMKFN